MTLNSVRLQSQVSVYDPADQENVYDMSHARRGHFLLINNRHFDKATGKSERRGSDVDAANLFTTFKQLGFEVNLKFNQTRQDMLRLAIDCKLSSRYCWQNFQTDSPSTKTPIFSRFLLIAPLQ